MAHGGVDGAVSVASSLGLGTILIKLTLQRLQLLIRHMLDTLDDLSLMTVRSLRLHTPHHMLTPWTSGRFPILSRVHYHSLALLNIRHLLAISQVLSLLDEALPLVHA